jgi:hypothetical protein
MYTLLNSHFIENPLTWSCMTPSFYNGGVTDLFGLSVKNLATRRVLARYNSTGPLYTLPHPTSTTPTMRVFSYALASAASSTIWHHRLGHPSPDVLSKLSCSLAITCPWGKADSLCHA